MHRVLKATDKIGSVQSEAFRTRKNLQVSDDSLAGRFITEMDAMSVGELTEQQKAKIEKEYKEEKEVQSKR